MIEAVRFDKILIANRGEIAVRIQRTARAMGYHTVAVCFGVDGNGPHAHLSGGPDDPHRDLPPIGDEERLHLATPSVR